MDRTQEFKIFKTTIKDVGFYTGKSGYKAEAIFFDGYPTILYTRDHGIPQTVKAYDDRPPELFLTFEEAVTGAQIIKNYWDKRANRYEK